MKTSSEVFIEVLVDLGFSEYKPSQMTNSDYWLCTCTAMERYANYVKDYSPQAVGELKKWDELKIGDYFRTNIKVVKHTPRIFFDD